MFLVRKNFQPSVSGLINEFLNNDWIDNVDTFRNISLPKSNITELEKSYKIEMMAPGYKKEDFNISIEDNMLVISVEKEEKKDETKDNIVYHEFSVSNFKRSFRLSNNVNNSEIDANYTDGILEIIIPKKEESVVKKLIEVK
jgi:HSP20 family protein